MVTASPLDGKVLYMFKRVTACLLVSLSVAVAGVSTFGQPAAAGEGAKPATLPAITGAKIEPKENSIEQLIEGSKKTNILNLSGRVLTMKDVNLMSQQTSLKTLILTKSNISDLEGSAIGKMSGLRDLILSQTNTGDELLSKLQGLKLSQIDLTGTKVTDKGLASLGKIESLNNYFTNRHCREQQRACQAWRLA